MIYGDGGHASVIKSFFDGWDGSVVAIGDNTIRKREVERLTVEGWRWTFAIHPKSIVADVHIGEGTVIMAGAVVQPNAWIGRHVIINTGATVDHDCVIEDYAHIAPGVHLCGNVHVGEGALVGVGSCAVPGAKIPAWSLVKAGSVVK